MLKWGHFPKDDTLHVVPCDEEGYIVKPHIASINCPCLPDIQFVKNIYGGNTMTIHNEIQ